MADTDILAQLLPALMQGGGAGQQTDPSSMGAIEAMQQSPFLQGVPSHSGPIGQISQAIMPLLASRIYGQQAERQQQMDKVKTLVSVLGLASQLKGYDLKDKEVQARLEELGVKKADQEHFHNLVDSLTGGGKELPENVNLTATPSGGSVSISGKPNYDLAAITAGAFKEQHGREPTKTELEKAITQREVEKQAGIVAATNAATIDMLRARGINIGDPTGAAPAASPAPAIEGAAPASAPFDAVLPKGMTPEEATTLVNSLGAQGKDVGATLTKTFGNAAPAPSPELSQSRGTYEPSRIDVTGGKLGVSLQRPKSSPETDTIVGRTQAIVGMRPRLDQVLKNTPDVPNIGLEATRYLLPSELAAKPGIGKSLEMGVIGGPNPKLTDYFQTVGEMNYAMTSLATRLASKSGSARMALLLQPHIPQLALQPSQNRKKLEGLFGPDSVLVQEFIPEGRKAVRSGDLSPAEFGDVLKNFDVIQSVFKQGTKLYGVNAKREVVPLE